MEKKFDFNDICIVPESISSISHRYEVNVLNEDGKLPIFVSPMDTVIDEINYKYFYQSNLEVCLPRNIRIYDNEVFISMSLDEFEEYVEWYSVRMNLPSKSRILVDIANGHMKRLLDVTKKFYEKRKSENHTLMVGNIANPKTYEQFASIGVEYIRVGIGGGSGCLTSANTGVHYPMASLISETYKIKKLNGYKTKIVADGGFRNFDDIIKALALGADYVMLGGILNKCLESCSQTKLFNKIPISVNLSNKIWSEYPFLRRFMTKNFRGMSTKQVQKKWNKTNLKTSEGISKVNKVEYTLEQWVNNFSDYLKSAMSYTNSLTLEEFKNSEYIFITQNAMNRYKK